MHMVTELTQYVGRPVYNSRGTFVGAVGNVIIDLPARRVGGLLITRTNPTLVDGGRDVAVPYRWVSAIGDIILLSSFPEHVTVVEETLKEEKAVEA
jgi:sporulation protein YlmC with PRC-barrel domain